MIYLDVAFKFRTGFVRYLSHEFQIAVIFRPSNNDVYRLGDSVVEILPARIHYFGVAAAAHFVVITN